MTDPFSVAERYLEREAESPRTPPIPEAPDEGEPCGIRICSAILESEIWLALDPHFDPADGLAVYYPEELPALALKTFDELKTIHQVKLVFGSGSKVKE
jgi:hypothetical protein